MYSDEDLKVLYGGPAPEANPTPAAEEIPFKTVKQVANIVPQIGNKLFSSAVNLLGTPGQVDQSDVEAAGHIAPTFDVGPTTGIKDAILNEAVPEIGAWLVPYLGATKLARGIGGAGRLAAIAGEAIGQGGANALSAERMGDEGHPLDSGILGAASGALQMALPRWQRALPLAAVSALSYAKNGNGYEAAGNFVGNMLPGAFKSLEATTPIANQQNLQAIADGLKPFDSSLNPSVMPEYRGNPRARIGPEMGSDAMQGRLSQMNPDYPTGALHDLGSFSFMDEVSSNFPRGTNDAPGAPIPHFQETTLNDLDSLKLDRSQTQREFQLESPETPTGLRLSEDTHFPREESKSITTAPDSDLNLVGQPKFSSPAMEQAEFPIIKLQSEGRLNPGDPNFTLPLEGIRPFEGTGELSSWRGDRVKRDLHLALEDAKSPIAPEPPTVTPPTPDAPPPISPPVAPPSSAVGSTEEKIASLEAQLAEIPTVKSNSASYKSRNALRSDLQSQIDALKKAAPTTPQAALPNIMTPSGNFMEIAPRMEGPHIISTVLDEGEGQFFATDKWKAPHQNGPDSIVTHHLEDVSGVGVSGYLIRDESGVIRVTTDRKEALQIAKRAGQTAKVEGELHSSDLIDPVAKVVESSKPKPAQVAAQEVLKTNDELANVESALRQGVEKAKAAGGLELRVAARKLQEFLVATKPEEAAAREAGVATKYKGTNFDADPKMATAGKDSVRRFRSRYSNESGAISPEAMLVLAAGGVAGLVAYQQTKGDIGATLASAAIIMGLGAAGARTLKVFKETVGPEAKIVLSSTKATPGVAKLTQLAIDLSHTPAGLAVGGRAGVWAQSNNLIEGLLGINQTPALKGAKVKADGFIAARIEELSKAFSEVRGVKPTAAFQAAEARFLRGQLADKVDVQHILNSGGSVMSDAYNGMSSANKAAFPEKWMVLDDPLSTNVKGDGVEIWHVSNTTKQALMKAQRDALRTHASTPEDLAYMSFPLKFRDVTDNIMSLYHDALPPGANKNRLTGTTGQYIARSHAIITDPKAYPSEVEIKNAMDRLGILKDKDFMLKTEAQFAPTPTHNTAVSWGGSTYYMSPRDAMDFKYLHSPESLKGEVRDYIKEIKQRSSLKNLGAIDADSEQFTSSLFTGRKELDEVTQALLGTHKTSSQMIQSTLDKIMPAGQAASFMKDAVRAVDSRTGLAAAMNHTEYNQAIESARKAMASGSVKAKNRYNELLSYTKAAENDKFGLTSDMFISRGLNERMKGFDGSPFGFLDNPIGKGLHAFNSFFKTTHLALSPASIARQIVQAPLMLAMGGVRDFESIATGFKGYMDRSSPVGQWMNEWGVFSSSAKHGDFNHTLQEVLSGEMDKTIWGRIQKGVAKMHGAFAASDDITRASVFMAEAKRAASDLGVPLDSLDPRVAARAQAFMLRRAMDFSNLPAYVKIGHEIPFVNIFLAYTHEIARVGFNTAVDAAKGDLQAGATLAGLATIPFMAQRNAENALSPEDRKAWDKAQALVPAYSRPRFKLPLSRNANGSFNYVDITSILPFSDYQMMGRAALKGDKEALAFVNPFVGLDNSPIFNVLGPQVAGKDFHTQREFRDNSDRIKNAAKQLLFGWTPGIGNEYVKDMPEALGGELGVTNQKNARTNTSIGAWLRNLTGLDYTQIDSDIAARNAVAAARGDIANERQFLKDVMMQQGISADAKKRATDRFTNSVTMIVSELQSRLQLSPSK